MKNDLRLGIDLPGRIKNTKLAYNNYLLPVFEAIINSFQAIEDRNNATDGVVNVILYRRPQKQIETGDNTREPIEAFEIEDNGIGFNDKNFDSFITADTMTKQDRGGKGVGRFVWLKAFNKVKIDSIFEENAKKFRRSFEFCSTPIGIENHKKNFVPHDRSLFTRVRLDGYKDAYQDLCPISAPIIGRRIIEHFLEYFLFQSIPGIYLNDKAANEIFNLNQIFEEDFKPNYQPNIFKIGKEEFIIQNVLLKKPHEYKHQAHFCAHGRVVKSEPLSKKIAHLESALHDNSGAAMYYNAYVSSQFLDERVDSDRTSFNIDQKSVNLMPDELTWRDIFNNVVEKSKIFLKPYTAPLQEEALERVKKYVETEAPIYRHLLSSDREAIKNISPTLPIHDLEAELHTLHFQKKNRLKLEAIKQLTQEEPEGVADWEAYKERFRAVFSDLNDIAKSELADYVVHRKTVLDFLEKLLGKDEDGKYAKEEAIHEIIFPLQETSDDIDFEKHNLWIVDERLVYHRYLASDIRLNKQSASPAIVTSSDRPDIIINAYCLSSENVMLEVFTQA